MTDQYLTERERVIQNAKLRAERRRERLEDIKGAASRLDEVREAEREAAQTRRGLFADAAVGAARGIPGAAEESFDLLAEFDEWALRKFGSLDFNPFDNTGQGFYRSPAELREAEADVSEFRVPERGWREIKELIPEPERGSGQAIEPISRFIAGFMTGKRALQGAKLLQGTSRKAQFANATVAGAGADLAVFDGHEQRLSNMVQEVPALRNPVTDYLEADEDDGELEARMKSALEGAGLGALFDGFIAGVRAIKGARLRKAAEKAVDEADRTEFKIADDATDAADDAADNVVDDAAEGAARTADDAETITPEELARTQVRSTVDLSPEQVEAFEKALAEGDETAATKVLSDFNEEYIDFDAIEDGQGIKNLLVATEEIMADHITEVSGGVQSLKQTRMLSNLVGANADEVHQLYRDVRGNKGISARFYAAQRVMYASAKELRRLMKKAKKTQAPADDAAVMRQMQIHAAIQAEIKGAQKEIARALHSMRMIKDQAADNFREFADLKQQFGDRTSTPKAWEKHLDEMLQAEDLVDFNAGLRQTPWERAKNVFVEYTINAMLSSPKTHAINFVSNVLNTFLYSADRLIAGTVRGAMGDRAAWKEAKIDMYSKVTRLDEAWKLAKQAFRDGLPVADKRQRIEFHTRKAISMDGDTWLAKSINFLGTTVRVPGRLLITGDEFFKAINRNAEMEVRAFRQADTEAVERGLEFGTEAYEKYVTKRTQILRDPEGKSPIQRQIQAEAIERARLTTFQESARTSTGSYMEKTINSNRFIKLIIAPFFRTPMNILRQGLLDRTPLGLALREHRETILRGHPRDSAEAMARMTTGIAAMSTFYSLISNQGDESGFEVVGKIPYDSSKKAQGVLDYSIRLGDNWYQFNRLDPLGMWLGIMADMKTHSEYQPPGADEETPFAFGQAAMGAFLNNAFSKTWMQSLADIQDTFERIDSGRPATVERAVNQFVAGEFGKLIPQLFKSTGRAVDSAITGEDPTAREAWGFLDNLNKQLPILNRDLPPRHDALGRPITWEAGPMSIVNPFATSPYSEDPVDQELARLAFTIRPMRKSLGSGAVDLTDKEYSKLTGLVAESGIHDVLTALVTSDGWKDIPDPLKTALIKERISEARSQARNRLLADPEVSKRLTKAQINAAMLLSGQEE